MSTEERLPLVELDDVGRKVWLSEDQELVILSSINLKVFAGDHIGIVGRSGTGKSTLLNLLGLLDKPSHGVMRWEGQDARALSHRRSARLRGKEIGFVFQQFNLLPKRSALENVIAPLMYADGAQFWSRRRIATEMLDLVGLGDRLHSDPVNLSGGEQQRVAIARALVRSPRLVLADEPTGALDVETGQHVMGLLDRITKERSMSLITITHDPAVAAIARRRYRLADGILTTLTPEGTVPESAPNGTALNDAALDNAALADTASNDSETTSAAPNLIAELRR